MAVKGTDTAILDLLAPGARVIVRDQEWHVEEVERQAMGGRAIVRCTGRSELVRGQAASFFTDLDVIEPEDPERTRFRLDTLPGGLETRLVIDSLVRRTPLPRGIGDASPLGVDLERQGSLFAWILGNHSQPGSHDDSFGR